MAPGEPLVVGLALWLDRRDARRIDGERLRTEGHEHRPAARPDPQPAVAQPLVTPRGLEQPGERIGIGVGGIDQQVAVFRERPGGIPSLLAGHVVAVHRVAIAVLQHLA